MEINLIKIKPLIKKYIEEFYKLKDKEKNNINLKYLQQIQNTNRFNTILLLIEDYIDEILLEYQIKNIKNKNISTGNKIINLLDADKTDENFETKCVDSNKLKLIGTGYFGKVFEFNKTKAVKIKNITRLFQINNKPDNLIKIIKNEYNISKKAGKLNVGPKIYNHFICKTDIGYYHIIYMENIKNSITLTDWLKKKRSENSKKLILDKIEEKIKILHKNNIIHHDIYGDNILIIKKPKIDIKIIDYGISYNSKTLIEKEKYIEYKNLKFLLNIRVSITDYIINKLLENNEIKILI